MKTAFKALLLLSFLLPASMCMAQKGKRFKSKEVYKSSSLVITQITKNTFEHTSFKQTNDFGNVPCNGLIVRNADEVIIFDTPTNDKTSQELIKWVKEGLGCQIKAVIPTHFHDDSAGGLKAFDEHQIPSYAYVRTIELAKVNNYVLPKNSFQDSLVLKVGAEKVVAKFFGEGHTKDNVVGYFPSEDVLFGGCLIKENKASKGYLGDANVADWSNTVEKIKNTYPHVKVVVPGHGQYGNQKLLDYTSSLFDTRMFGSKLFKNKQ
jgi:metallo-beta-lactamase class B